MKLWRNLSVVTTAVVAAVACSDTYHVSEESNAIVIDPTVSRASELNFDSGDRIGVTVIKGSDPTPYLSNTAFTSDGSVFTGGGTVWYSDISQSADIRAYYPYQSAGEPRTFTVQNDQSGDGYSLSDFMTAVTSGVRPTSNAVSMVFRHRLVKINISVTNNTAAKITEVGILSCALTATADVASESVGAYAQSGKGDIKARETAAQKEYNAIIPPQTAALTFYASLDDGSAQRSVTMTSAEFTGGKQYTAHLTIDDQNIGVKVNGQIEEWGGNTDLTPESSSGGSDGKDDKGNNGGQGDTPGQGGPEESGTVSWGGVDYPFVTLDDGNTWFAANLRYVPAGKSPSDAPGDGSGLWYPCNASKAASTDESFIASHGYLYNGATAHGGSTTTGEAAVRGVCPEGWHLPTASEFDALKAAYPTVSALKASAFGFISCGCINPAGAYYYKSNSADELYLLGSSVSGDGTYCMKISAGASPEYNVAYNFTGASVRCVRDK